MFIFGQSNSPRFRIFRVTFGLIRLGLDCWPHVTALPGDRLDHDGQMS